ncbi:tetratricopeptide repeat protein [Desulfovibrio piger]|nr:tetratricopeptide repeat protein [Desulfovibrio piger]
MVGKSRSKGLGGRQDDGKALQLWEQSAAKGFVPAQLLLGYLYYRGEGGVGQDYGMARQWWEKAADRGNPSAQVSIGAMYEHGEGVKKDLAAAREWYDKACGRGFKEGCTELERLNRK